MSGKLVNTESHSASPAIQPAVATTAQPPIVLASASVPAVTFAPTHARNEFLVRAVDVTPAIANELRLDQQRGVMLLSIGVGGAAMVAGLRERDVILDFNGLPLSGIGDMQQALATITPGTTAIANIWRDGAERSVQVRF